MNMALSVELADLMQLQATENDDDIQKKYLSATTGFQNSASEYANNGFDLNKICIINKLATFGMRAVSESMIDASIGLNDILVIDRSLNPKNLSIVIAKYNGHFVVRRFILDPHQSPSSLWLKAENPEYPSIYPKDGDIIIIWGVLTRVIKNMLV
jgi:DNA polymerase V